MCHPVFLDSQTIAEIPEDVAGMKILDVGCGPGNLARLILSYRHNSVKQNIPLIIGVDLDTEVSNFIKQFSNYGDLVLADSRYLPFKNATFDIVAALEIIEHVPKEDGYRMIREAERVAKTKVILSTPNGFCNQGCIPADTGRGYEHLSGWNARDFRKLGFKVRGVGSRLALRLSNKKLVYLLYLLFTPLSYILPVLSQNLMCTKYLQKEDEPNEAEGKRL